MGSRRQENSNFSVLVSLLQSSYTRFTWDFPVASPAVEFFLTFFNLVEQFIIDPARRVIEGLLCISQCSTVQNGSLPFSNATFLQPTNSRHFDLLL